MRASASCARSLTAVLATLVAISIAQPAAAQDVEGQNFPLPQDEIFLVQIVGEAPFHVVAESVSYDVEGLVTLESGGEVVAAFETFQLAFAARADIHTDRAFEIKTHEGDRLYVPAHEVVIADDGMVRLEIDGELVGVVYQPNVRYVVAAEAGS